MTDRADIERIVENVLRDLTIEVTEDGWPNTRCVILKMGSRELSRDTFSIIEVKNYYD
jgi:hypothetical protein